MSSVRHNLVVFLLASWLVVVLSTQASERSSESVELTFYQLSTSEWSNRETSFKNLVAAEAIAYCTANAATCGLSSGFLFTDNEIGVESGPTEESQSLKISFYIDFPTVHVLDSSSTTTYVINKATVTTIFTNIRESLETTVGADITYIDSEFYSIEPDSLLNKIMIPIAFIVLLGIIILAVALHVWNKRKEQQLRKKQRALDREKRKKTSRIAPVYIEETEVKKSAAHWLRKSRKKKASFKARDTNGNVPTLSMKTNVLSFEGTGASNQPSAADNGQAHYEDPVPLRNNALPPLPNPASEEEGTKEKQERKREKKERKRRKKEKSRQSSAHSKLSAEDGREETEDENSRTESLEKNVIPVEDGPEVVA